MKAIKNKLGKKEPKVMVVGEDEGEDENPKPAVAVVEEETEAPVTSGGIPIVADIDGEIDALQPSVRSEGVPAAIRDAETLEIVFLEEVMDYPVIGKFNFQVAFGITRVRKHQKFVVPRNVALTLYDKKLVSIPGLE